MTKKVKKHQQSLAVILIIACMGAILLGGISYISKLRRNLQDNEMQNLMTVAVQQQQGFDTFISEGRERLHSFAEFLGRVDVSPEYVQLLLTLPGEEDAIYLVISLDEGWVCGTSFDDIRQLDEENLNIYRSLGTGGVREAYTGLYSGTSRFSFYETFTFADGNKGLIQKSYDRKKIFDTFSLSFYNDQGSAYVVNRQGDIQLRPVSAAENDYDNIFDMFVQNQEQQKDIDYFMEELRLRATGSMAISGDNGEFIYTYVPIESVEGWYLVSVVPADTIASKTNQILLEFRIALGLLFLFLFIVAVFVLVIWRAQRKLLVKDKEIEYQEQSFDIFAAYLASNTNDVYIMMDCETEKVEYITPNAEQVLGMEAEDMSDLIQIDALTVENGRTMTYHDEIRALSPGMPAVSRNTERVNHETGEHRYFLESVYCTAVQGRNKWVCYISDRTREREIHNSLVEALKMAQAANDAKSAFLSSVSHDIRTPMNAIIGFLALMRDEVDKPAIVMEYSRRIDAACQHLLGLINDVLDMNKIESGSTTLNISEVNLAEIIDEINTIIRPQAKAKKQTFDISVSHLNYEHLMGDKLRINQILINLLSNAVKYTPENGSIQMKVEELPRVVDDYSRIRFTVSDNGMGMSKEYLKVIFDPFTREESAVINQTQGTGLGMAITKRLVDLMGGGIRVESELGGGSTFTVELELRIQIKEDEPEFWSNHKVTRMIVIDDEEEVCHGIVKAMAQTGVVTDYAMNGEKAVQMMRMARESGQSYDLILLDWKMPNVSGMETARLIRKNYSEKIPILLLTAYDWDEIEEEAREIGINHFMPKPFFMSTFKEVIRRVMSSAEKAEGRQLNIIQGKRVLIVDDIDANRFILMKILSTMGAECDIACNGQEAVEKFKGSEPGEYDLIMMDVQMPVMNGYDATRAIRGSSHPLAKKVPIIAMTANAFVDDVRDAIESGMDAHVAKPVQRDKLNAAIEQVLSSRQ